MLGRIAATLEGLMIYWFLVNIINDFLFIFADNITL